MGGVRFNQQRGEIVLILDAAPPRDEADDAVPENTVRVLKLLAAELPTKQAASLAAQICGANRKQLYDLALKLKQD